ncbi:MAG: dienelactone hydrolase family protein [Burkholderiales bacterium]|nr:dienelactone hydrolase family protein [Burkholderiales bacterium]
MQRKTARDFPPEVLRLFDGYVHGNITRREFLDRAARYATAGVTAAAMLEMLRPNFAWAQQVAKDDARIKAGYQDYPSPQGSGTMRGYLAMPAKAGPAGCIVVIHENRGLNPYIEDVARRLAIEGYMALAPDALAPLGGYPGDEEKALALFAKLDPANLTEDVVAAVPYLRSRAECNGRVAAVGFCFGGSMVNVMATRFPDLAGAVPYYGGQPKAEDAARVRSPLLLHYAGEDARVNAGWPAYESVLKANGVKHEMHMYPGTQHGFHNDTTPRYDEAAAKLSWARTAAFFKLHLKG